MSDMPLPPETPILTGRKLSGRYVLKTLISLRKTTQIWEADDLVLTRKVAVKLTHPELIYESAFIKKFRSEARMTAKLNHSSIVSIYDTTGDEEVEAIVMELIEGMPLRAYLDEEGPMPIENALGLLNQVVDALQHAHQQGIFHGNLNPNNIFLCSGQRVKVTDFGLSSPLEILRNSNPEYLEERSPYLSPEQCDGENPNERSDIYSLGLIFLEILSGTSPSELHQRSQEEIKDVLEKRMGEVPISLQEGIMRALETLPAKRFPNPVGFRSAITPNIPKSSDTKDSMDYDPKTPERDKYQIVTAVLTIGMVFTFILAIIFAANIDDNLFGNNSSDSTSPTIAETEEDASPEEEKEEEIVESTETPQEETTTESPTSGEEETTVSPIFEETPIISAQDFDPLGDGVEHPELLANLYDNDSTTAWKTETYGHRSLGFLKPGVGVIVELEKAIPLHSLEIDTEAVGWSGEIYVSDVIGSTLEDWGEPIETIEANPGSASINLTGNAGSVVLIWITDLGDAPPSLKIEISEIRIT
ncbi:MAG: serine/threonine protein kinase [Acidimicrobiales bacterium]|nr:serine/threonine protein kinase [Acidimicrobiales bacterium]